MVMNEPSQHSSVCRASAWSHTVRQLQNDGSPFLVQPAPTHGYVDKNSLDAMLAAKWSAGVSPEVNPQEHVASMPLASANKAARYGFETQRRHHQPKQGYQRFHTKDFCHPKIKKEHGYESVQWAATFITRKSTIFFVLKVKFLVLQKSVKNI